MPLKPLKKTGGKRKQNGKKAVRGQTSKAKQKHELESSPKEQISELEKEILTIKINEYESKLHRKNELCAYFEEEISIYRTLYDEKQLLKSESMKLLNNAFEDFSTEICLLDHELDSMQQNYNRILKEQTYCLTYRKKVENLQLLERELEKELDESEKCSGNIPALAKNYQILEEKASKKKEMFMNENLSIVNEFELCLQRIQEELNQTTERMIDDYSLKLNLLPVPYKALFLSGLLTNSWLESSTNCYVLLQTQNAELHKKLLEFRKSADDGEKKMKELFSLTNVTFIAKDFKNTSERKSMLPDMQQKEKRATNDKEIQLLLLFERMCLNQQKKVSAINSEIENLEKNIKSIENTAVSSLNNSYLVKVVCTAGNILKAQF